MDAPEHARVVAVGTEDRQVDRGVAGRHRVGPTAPVGSTRPVHDDEVADAYLDEQEDESFPASDPHADWSGAPSWW